MALTASRNTALRQPSDVKSFPVAAATTLYQGGIACTNAAGNLVPASTALHLKCVGRIEGDSRSGGDCDNSTGAAADKYCDVKKGIFLWANSAGADAITNAARGQLCYLVDDQTVALTDASGTRSIAGVIEDVETAGVWVRMGECESPRKTVVEVTITDVSAASDSTFGYAPFAGRVTKVFSILGGAITGADSAVTSKIGATAITGGALTIANASSAAGDLDVAHPTALNVVSLGSKLWASTDGASTGTQTLRVYFEIEADG